ncbi:MAG: class I SAM-dependent methyltransferase [Gammaproteobacteria bacterium]
MRRLQRWREHRNQIAVIDLGCGTGANMRFLAPRLGGRQHWTLVDNDTGLLDQIRVETSCSLETRCLDIAHHLDAIDFSAFDLVTASALLDLTSKPWQDALANRCRQAEVALFITLSYDGLMRWRPADRDDALCRRLMNRHQRTDKGFGPALGPRATHHLAASLRSCGYRVHTGASLWRLDARHAGLQEALLAGYAHAARVIAPAAAARIDAWHGRRLGLLPTANFTVGHRDLFAEPGAKRKHQT